MPIDLNVNSPQQTRAPQRTDSSRFKGLEAVRSSPVSWHADQINVSNHVEYLVARAKSFDNPRQLHIESLRQIVQSGQHEVSSSEIATAILREEN